MDTDIAPTAEPGQKYLRTRAAAKFLGLSPHTLAVWRVTGRHELPWHAFGRAVAYSLDDLEAFAAANRRRTTSDGTPAR